MKRGLCNGSGRRITLRPTPSAVRCPSCGAVVEIWWLNGGTVAEHYAAPRTDGYGFAVRSVADAKSGRGGSR